tara:strand:+ start:101 stop:319 length:219 start_codon:yes stop_codon:yes gene_type:complete
MDMAMLVVVEVDVMYVITAVDIAKVLGRLVLEQYLVLVDGEHLPAVVIVLVVTQVEWVWSAFLTYKLNYTYK